MSTGVANDERRRPGGVFDPRGVAYFGGRYVPIERATVSVATQAFNYGTGCFEGIRGYWEASSRQIYLVKLREHLERLLRSATILRIDVGYSVDQLCEIAVEVVRRTGYEEDVYVRPIAYKAARGIRVELVGLEDGFCCYTAPMGPYVDMDQGVKVAVSGWRRNDDNAIPARAKTTGGYINAALAVADAHDAGFDEAILLTGDGHVSEASTSNLFLLAQGALVTPAVSDDILVGITRESIIQLATTELHLSVQERQVDRTELYGADEMFLCGTGVQVAPITSVDGRRIGDGMAGEVTRALQSIYLDAVHGRREEYRAWLTPVYGSGRPIEASFSGNA